MLHGHEFAAILLIARFTVTQSSSPSSVFIYDGGFTGSNITFAINLASDSEDLYFHLNGPSKFSWIAIGTGDEMQDSLMFIAYASSDGSSTYRELRSFVILKYSTRHDIEP